MLARMRGTRRTAAVMALVPVIVLLAGGCSDSVVDCVAADSTIDYVSTARGETTLDAAIERLGEHSDSVDVRHRTDSSAVVYTIRDGRPTARYEVEARDGQGWLVTSAASCRPS